MPTQDSYPALASVDANTYLTGFRKDPVSGVLTTYKVPATFSYGSKWTAGTGAPSVAGTGVGDMYLDELTGNVYQWNNTTLSWGSPIATLISGVYDIPIWIEGKPLNSETVYTLVAPRGFSLPVGLPNSQAVSTNTTATASTVFSINRNGTQIGTITFAATASTGTFSFARGTTFFAGDLLSVVAPATADATLANIAITLAGTRP